MGFNRISYNLAATIFFARQVAQRILASDTGFIPSKFLNGNIFGGLKFLPLVNNYYRPGDWVFAEKKELQNFFAFYHFLKQTTENHVKILVIFLDECDLPQ